MAEINQGQEAHRQHHPEMSFGADGKQHTSKTSMGPGPGFKYRVRVSGQ